MRHRGGVPFTVAAVRAAAEHLEVRALPRGQSISLPIERGSVLDVETRRAADELAEWARPKGKKRTPGIGDASFVRILDEATAMLASGEWSKARSTHFVALYADLHFRVYGVEAADLGSKERVYAANIAGKMLSQDFAGDPHRMARFVAWTWSRERATEAWRRENGREGGRLTWRAQFGKKLLTDYRLDEARRKTR